MEDKNKDLRDRDDLRSDQQPDSFAEPQNAEGDSAMEASASTDEQRDETRKHRHHSDHVINRKYRPFSNHSSNDDMPHTNTSF